MSVEHLSMNPFAFITKIDSGFLIYNTDDQQITIGNDYEPFVEFVQTHKTFTLDEVKRFLSDKELDDYISRRVLLYGEGISTEGRYSRQLGFFSLLTDEYLSFQDKLESANVLLLGAGAIGTHVLWNLAAMGVRQVTIIDFDTIEESNLNRQLMYTPDDIGKPKVEILCRRIHQFNPKVQLFPIQMRIESAEDIERHLNDISIVIKAIDTPEDATEWVNQVCVKHKIPFINGGFLDHIGVVGPVYLPGESVCAACLGFKNARRVSGTGPTFGPLTMMVASMVSMLSFRVLVGQTSEIRNKLHIYNTKKATWDTVDLRATDKCSVCGHNPREITNETEDNHKNLWSYRIGMICVFILASLFRYLTSDFYVGLLALFVMFLSFLFIDSWFEGRRAELRKEIFTISSLYCVISLITNVFINARTFITAAGTGFNLIFSIIQDFSYTLLEISISISILFFLSNIVVYLVKLLTGKGSAWLS